jgi:hypothetical protein
MSAVEVLAAQSAPMTAWLAWMFAINFCSMFFLRHVPARRVLAATPANFVSMQPLLRLYGTGAPSEPAARLVLDATVDLSVVAAEFAPAAVAVRRTVRPSVFDRPHVAGPRLCGGRKTAAALAI